MKKVLSAVCMAALLLCVSTKAHAVVCYIDQAICGFQSPGSASQTINQFKNTTILNPHSITQANDGTWEMDVVFNTTVVGGICSVLWGSPTGTFPCPDIHQGSNGAFQGNAIVTEDVAIDEDGMQIHRTTKIVKKKH